MVALVRQQVAATSLAMQVATGTVAYLVKSGSMGTSQPILSSVTLPLVITLSTQRLLATRTALDAD